LRGSFPDNDPRAVRHHDRRFQHQAHQLDHPTIRHPLTDPVEEALMMDSIEDPELTTTCPAEPDAKFLDLIAKCFWFDLDAVLASRSRLPRVRCSFPDSCTMT
jgi:hypothetical protein